MKSLLVLIAFLCMQQAIADGVAPLKDGDLSLSQADAKIVSVREICPANPGGIRCMAVGSIVTLKVTLGGCLDRFGGHFSKFEYIDGKGVLYFGAINIFNKASAAAYCIKAPTKIVTVHVPFEGEIELVNMDYTGTILPAM